MHTDILYAITLPCRLEALWQVNSTSVWEDIGPLNS